MPLFARPLPSVVALGLVLSGWAVEQSKAQGVEVPAGKIEEIVYDSLLARGPLRNATVYVIGTTLAATSGCAWTVHDRRSSGRNPYADVLTPRLRLRRRGAPQRATPPSRGPTTLLPTRSRESPAIRSVERGDSAGVVPASARVRIAPCIPR